MGPPPPPLRDPREADEIELVDPSFLALPLYSSGIGAAALFELEVIPLTFGALLSLTGPTFALFGCL